MTTLVRGWDVIEAGAIAPCSSRLRQGRSQRNLARGRRPDLTDRRGPALSTEITTGAMVSSRRQNGLAQTNEFSLLGLSRSRCSASRSSAAQQPCGCSLGGHGRCAPPYCRVARDSGARVRQKRPVTKMSCKWWRQPICCGRPISHAGGGGHPDKRCGTASPAPIKGSISGEKPATTFGRCE